MKKTALLFSGGRDSTAAAVKLYERGDELHLLSFRSGLTLHDGYRALREVELKEAFGPGRLEFHELDIRGLVRHVCFVNLVNDISTDGCQLILLGEVFCMFAASILYARQHSCTHIAFGATAYQSHFPEQRPETVDLFRVLLERNGLVLETPGISWSSEALPKEILRMAGLSTKSLESTSLLSDIDDNQAVEAVVAYSQRKLVYVNKLLSERSDTSSRW